MRCPDHLVWCEKCKTCARPDMVSGPCGTKKPSYPIYPGKIYPTYPKPASYPSPAPYPKPALYPKPAPYPAY